MPKLKQDEAIADLLKNNKKWAMTVATQDPDFFVASGSEQSPDYLWIGCSDSRVPAEQITLMAPGSIFVHRNIANVVVHTDANTLSVVYYAVTALKVKHIIVCGHYNCGGVIAAISRKHWGFIDNWLLHLKDIYYIHQEELDAISDMQQRANRLVELNVIEQVHHLGKISFIQESWAENNNSPALHGLVYDVKTGFLKDLGVTVNSTRDLHKVYQFEERELPE